MLFYAIIEIDNLLAAVLHDGRVLIRPKRNRFGDFNVHRRARELLDQCLDGAWVTYTKIPVDLKRGMFNCFRTMYRWDSHVDQAVYKNFINVPKERFRDIMSKRIKKSKEDAIKAGHEIPADGYDFQIQHNGIFHPLRCLLKDGNPCVINGTRMAGVKSLRSVEITIKKTYAVT